MLYSSSMCTHTTYLVFIYPKMGHLLRVHPSNYVWWPLSYDGDSENVDVGSNPTVAIVSGRSAETAVLKVPALTPPTSDDVPTGQRPSVGKS